MFLHKTPSLVRLFYPNRFWKVQTNELAIYLTFDDGPIPEVTPWVLDTLKKYKAQATFFCVGDNVEKHPEIFNRLTAEGHSVGNHTHNHLNGWLTSKKDYLENIALTDNLLAKRSIETNLFRPPYGKIKWAQARKLGNKRLVMWDVLSGDFSSRIPSSEILHQSIKNTSAGSIIVFHDNVKAFEKLKEVLPQYLSHFSGLGYKFKAL